MRHLIVSLICAIFMMVLSFSAYAQDIATTFKMPVGYPDGSGWSLNGGWGYLEYESGYDDDGNWFDYNVYHPGEDLNLPGGDCGEEVRASANGEVTEAGYFGTECVNTFV